LNDLGQRLRHLRRVAGMTIEQVAGQIGVTKGYLSKIETGASDPSVAVLGRLAEAFGVPMSTMFESGGGHELSVVRSNERLPLNRPGSKGGYVFESLVYRKANRGFEAFLLTYPPRKDPTTYRHPGEEVLYLLEGELLFRYAGVDYILKPGDCVSFDARVEHKGEAYGDKPAKALVVVIPGPPDGPKSRRTKDSK
jgi:transcriptional regulator with XRE-family HTH domain